MTLYLTFNTLSLLFGNSFISSYIELPFVIFTAFPSLPKADDKKEFASLFGVHCEIKPLGTPDTNSSKLSSHKRFELFDRL